MKKILISESLKQLFTREASFFNRNDITLIYAETNDDLLRKHIDNTADIIITTFDGSDLSVESFFSIVKQGSALQKALLIIVCNETPGLVERGKRCGANVILTLPIDHAQLSRRIQELLDVAPRKAYRVVFNIAVDGKFRNRPFMCRSENVSTSGMLISTRENMDLGDRVACSFYLPDGMQVLASGEVVRVARKDASGNAYGIKFTDISTQHKAALEMFIEREYKYRLSLTQQKSAFVA